MNRHDEVSTLETTAGSDGRKSIRIVRGCPCFKVFGNERLCVNDDSVLEIDVIGVDPTLFEFHNDKTDMDSERAEAGNICYCSVYINYPDNRVYCISQGWTIRIHNRDVRGQDLEDALQFLSTKDVSQSAEICSECLYKFLLTLSDQFADTMTKKEKTDEIKRYVDKFSIMIAVRHSQTDPTMRPIGTEADYSEGLDRFAFLRSYLVQLLEQQAYWSSLATSIKDTIRDDWIIELIRDREMLARLEFQFYSQTLQLRDLYDFNLMIRMLSLILRTADDILTVNKRIHDKICSDRFKSYLAREPRLALLSAYTEKSRAVEHNFGNILQILSRL